MEIRIETPDQQALTTQAERVLNVAQAYKISDGTMYALAADELKQIKAKITTLDGQRKAITKPLDEVKAKVMDLFRRPLEILQQAETVLKRAILTYDEEQERIRREQEERIRREQDEARRKAEADAAEARRKAEEAARAAREAASQEERAQAEANLQAASQALEQAQVEEQTLATAPTPFVPPATPKVGGISKRSNWKGECFDAMALIKAVAAGEAPATLLEVNYTVLNQMAKALKGAMSYPGCRAVEEKLIASGRR